MNGIMLLAAAVTVSESAGSSGNSGVYSIVTAIGGLILFAVIMAAAYFGMKFFGNKAGYKTGGSRNIVILERVYLSQDKMLLLVKTGGKIMLLGAAQGEITVLSEIDETALDLTERGSPGLSFANVFENVIKERKDRDGNKK
ncbi:MAG: flagellar biosynthetic protein FliO [Oscillospiraceae bacterium]|nr:flagellar biosynthetic protein FliO [Oscillospiraceae bacterium]